MTTLTDLQKANKLLENKKYAEAEAFFTKALEDVKQAAKKDTAKEIAILNQLGQLYLEQDEFKKAENAHAEALELCKTTLDTDVSESVLLTVSLLCAVYEAQSQFDKALKLYNEAIETASQMLGGDDPDIAIAKCSQAAVYIEQGEFAKAQEAYESALPIIEKYYPEEADAIQEIKENLALAKEKALQPA